MRNQIAAWRQKSEELLRIADESEVELNELLRKHGVIIKQPVRRIRRKKLLWFGIICMLLGFVVSLLGLTAHGQPETNQTALLKQLVNQSKTQIWLQQYNEHLTLLKLQDIEVELQQSLLHKP